MVKGAWDCRYRSFKKNKKECTIQAVSTTERGQRAFLFPHPTIIGK